MCTTRDHVCILALCLWVVAAMCYVYITLDQICILELLQQCLMCTPLYIIFVSCSCISDLLSVRYVCATLEVKFVSLWCLHLGSYHHFISVQAGCLTGQGGRIILWSDICVWNLMLYICFHVYVFIFLTVVHIGSLLTKHNSCITLWQPSPDEENRPGPRSKTHFYFCFYLGLSW